MTRQIGCDREDLCLNGDEKFAKVKEFSSSASYTAGDLVAYNDKVYQYTAATLQAHLTQARPPSWVLSMTPTSSR